MHVWLMPPLVHKIGICLSMIMLLCVHEMCGMLCSSQVMVRLIRRYKYLQKSLDGEMKKILIFLKAFSETERRSLAIFTGLCMAESLVSAGALISLIQLSQRVGSSRPVVMVRLCVLQE